MAWHPAIRAMRQPPMHGPMRRPRAATSIKGPGYGKYGEASLVGVDAGDLIAMQLTHGKKTFSAFADANETVDGSKVNHLWNYGVKYVGLGRQVWRRRSRLQRSGRATRTSPARMATSPGSTTRSRAERRRRPVRPRRFRHDRGRQRKRHPARRQGQRHSDRRRRHRHIRICRRRWRDRMLDYKAGEDLFDLTGIARRHGFGDLLLQQINSNTVLIDFDGVPGGDTVTIQKTTIAQLNAESGRLLVHVMPEKSWHEMTMLMACPVATRRSVRNPIVNCEFNADASQFLSWTCVPVARARKGNVTGVGLYGAMPH